MIKKYTREKEKIRELTKALRIAKKNIEFWRERCLKAEILAAPLQGGNQENIFYR